MLAGFLVVGAVLAVVAVFVSVPVGWTWADRKGDKAGLVAGLVVHLTLVLVGGAVGAAIQEIETGEGTATGLVTAVERSGVFWKTTSVYVKTDLESTQEERYCVANRALGETLRESARSRTRIEVEFTTYLLWGDGCEFDGPIITTVREIA